MTTGCMVSFVSDRLCPLYLSLSLSLPVFVPHPLFAEAPCEVNVSCWFSTHSLTDTAIALVCFGLIMVAMVLHAVAKLITIYYPILYISSLFHTHLHQALATELQHNSTCCSLSATGL